MEKQLHVGDRTPDSSIGGGSRRAGAHQEPRPRHGSRLPRRHACSPEWWKVSWPRSMPFFFLRRLRTRSRPSMCAPGSWSVSGGAPSTSRFRSSSGPVSALKGSMKSSSVPSARMTAVVRLPVHRSSRRHLCGTQPVRVRLRRAVRNRHRHAIEQASRRWRGGRRGDSARTRRKILIPTQGGTRRTGGSPPRRSRSRGSRSRAPRRTSGCSRAGPPSSRRPSSPRPRTAAAGARSSRPRAFSRPCPPSGRTRARGPSGPSPTRA